MLQTFQWTVRTNFNYVKNCIIKTHTISKKNLPPWEVERVELLGDLWGCKVYYVCCLPYAVENVPVGKDPNVNVGHQDVMEASFLLVSEEGVWHPNFFGVSHC